MSRRLAPLLLAVGVLLVGVLAWLPSGAAPAGAATATVEVRDRGYEPATITVRVGDRVTWRWVGEQPHSVTSLDGGASFDSHPDCAPAAPDDCGTAPHTFTWLPSEPGSYGYGSRAAPGMLGTVVAEEPAGASPSPTGAEPTGDRDPSPSPEPSSPPPSRPDGDGDTGASEDPGTGREPTDDAEADDAEASAPRAAPTRGRADGPAVGIGTVGPSPGGDAEPDVAPPGPRPTTSLEPFPSARPLPSPTTTADAVTLAAGGGGPGRSAWLAVGSASVLAAAGAFGRLVLFGPPWR